MDIIEKIKTNNVCKQRIIDDLLRLDQQSKVNVSANTVQFVRYCEKEFKQELTVNELLHQLYLKG